MSGSGAAKRQQLQHLHAARLARQGWTHRAIAEAIGKRPEQIKAMIVLGERLAQITETAKAGREEAQ